MASKLVLKRQRSAEKVLAQVRTHRERVATGLSQNLGAQASNASLVLMEIVAAKLAGALGSMVEADDAHVCELSNDDGVRAQRDRAFQDTRAVLLRLREVLVCVFGPEYLRTLGFSGATPMDPFALLRVGQRVALSLRNVPPPPSQLTGYVFPAGEWAEKLSRSAASLEQALEDVARETRRAEAAYVTKERAISIFDEALRACVVLAGSLFDLAGDKELARYVRAARRRTMRAKNNGAAVATNADTTEAAIPDEDREHRAHAA